MKRAFAFVLAVCVPCHCGATIIDERDLAEIYESSNTVVYGSVKSARAAKCGGSNEVSGLYVLRVINVVKGDVSSGEITVCVQASMSISDHYIVAGDRYGRKAINAAPDAIVFSATPRKFYRLISDSPFRDTPEGEVYATGKLVPDFMRRFGHLFGSVDF